MMKKTQIKEVFHIKVMALLPDQHLIATEIHTGIKQGFKMPALVIPMHKACQK